MYDKNELNIELLSTVGLNSWVGNNSGAREYMFSSHIGQRLIIKGATEKRILTGMEVEFAKYTFAARMPVDGTVIKTIQKYTPNMSDDSIIENTKISVIYEEYDTKRINVLDIPAYKSFHQNFGYRLVEKPIMSELKPGLFIPKDTVLADSPSVSDVGGYKFGIELNVAFMSHPAAAEDGILISRDVLPKLTYTKFETRVIEFGENAYPINLYGDDKVYKAFPDIGEYLRDDGLLCCLRKNDINTAPALLDVDNIRKVDFINDDKIYVGNGKAKVVDINVIYNKAANAVMPDGAQTQVEKYIRASQPYYQNLLKTEREIFINRSKKYGHTKLDIGPELHRLLYEAHVMTDHGGDRAGDVINKLYRNSPLDKYRIEIVVEYEVMPDYGAKLTGLHG